MTDSPDANNPLRIDLNADLGETAGDLDLMSVVTSANVACGGHAGDRSSMTKALSEAAARGIAVGAHASYDDRAGFGRVELHQPAREVALVVAVQVTELAGIADRAGTRVSYVKLHGALYHRAGKDAECASAILDALAGLDAAPFAILAQPGGAIMDAALRRGWPVATEGFCDRSYLPNGELVGRDQPGALLTATELVIQQALGLAVTGSVTANDGTSLALRPSSLCIHGDTPGALELGRQIRIALEDAGVALAPFAPARV